MTATKPQPRVIVFSTPTCSFCNMAKTYFREKGIKFNDVDVSKDPAAARGHAERIGRFMWEHRALFQADLTPLDEALRIAAARPGLTVFSDAADATASGAAGDSNAILKGLVASR